MWDGTSQHKAEGAPSSSRSFCRGKEQRDLPPSSVVMPILNLSGPCRTLGTTPQKPFSGPGVTVHALSACRLLWHEDCKPWSPLHRLLLFVRIFPLGCNCLGASRAWGRSIRCSERRCWVLSSSTCPEGSTAIDIDTGVPNIG